MKRTMNGLPLVLASTAVLLSTWAVAADEQQSNTSLGYGPWAQGVSPGERKAADELFQAGNAFMEESVFVEAEKKYRAALEHWKHPAIHYNLALALMNFNQPTETHAQLVAATHYGPDPLDSEKYQHALKYKNLLENQLTWVQITCDEPDATVTLDGRALFVAPGRFEGLMHPGMHSLVAIKKGYVYVDNTSLVLNPGERANLNLKLYTEEQLIVHRSRWPVWIPWAVMGSGLAVAAGGGLLHLQTDKDYRGFDAGIVQCGGCEPEPGLANTRARGDTLQTAAYGAYALGGAALVGSAVLLYLNRPQPHRINPATGAEVVNVTPLVGDTNGLLATFRF
ncbi:hypothetical protein JRI60_04805 [Archangium violaceum]|uniref:hypothetical protein n=1 Tax=Archangium violaceum TaxID=83451 RepID=UPI00195126B7|nr:hypothetical protein [Archangium violaceum]QRN98386.1 hypothetical protein JRI60_04805 [Archangium violaceum]